MQAPPTRLVRIISSMHAELDQLVTTPTLDHASSVSMHQAGHMHKVSTTEDSGAA